MGEANLEMELVVLFLREGDAHAAGGILFPQLGIRPISPLHPLLWAWSLNRGTASEVAVVTVPEACSVSLLGPDWGVRR